MELLVQLVESALHQTRLAGTPPLVERVETALVERVETRLSRPAC